MITIILCLVISICIFILAGKYPEIFLLFMVFVVIYLSGLLVAEALGVL